MLRVLSGTQQVCDGISRREALRVGGLSLFGGLTLPSMLRAKEADLSRHTHPAKAKSVVLINLFGGPPHQDMVDLKPHAPANIRGEFSPIATTVPGIDIGDLLPKTAVIMDRCTLIRTYSHRYNSHNPYNVLTGFDLGNDRENYFAKRSDHPSVGSVCQYMDIGPHDVPRYVTMPAFPGYSQALRRAGPYGGYLGSQYDPLFTICSPEFARKSANFYDPVTAGGQPVLPSLDELPNVTADRLDRRKNLLQQFDEQLRQIDASRTTNVMTAFQRKVFELLTSPKTRAAFDLNQEPASTRDNYGRNLWGSSMLIARRLVEAGTTFVTVNWEAENSGHWDLHENNFGMCRAQCPQLDAMFSTFVLDLDQRGLLDSTLVVLMGEMGRTPRVNGKAGRDHWPQCGFVLLAGGGTKRGFLLGKTDSEAAYPIDRPVSAGDMVATIYQLVGIDPHLMVPDLTSRPIHISHGGEPVWEILV